MENDRPLANLHLPESVIHNILSSLPPNDAIRASATSRQWRSAWISSPFLDFDEKPMPFHGADFLDYVDRSLALWRDRCDGRAKIERLSISGAIANGDQFDSSSRLAEIVAFAASRHVKAIELLNCPSSHPKLSYSDALWKSLCACQSLRELSLDCCRLVLSGSSSPIASSLRKLALSFSIIGDSSLQILLSSVPSLEHLDVKFCSGLDELRVALDSLRTMRFFSWEDQAPDIVVEAANLRSFSYSRAFNPVSSVCFSNCRSLTSVEIECVYFGTVSAIDECISQIPSLENLTLDECEMRSGVRITHSNLKSLNLQSCFGLLRAEIDTPNLRWFSYCGGIYQFSRFKHCSGLLNVRLALGARNLGWVWFINLRNFLESFSDCNVLTLTCYLEVGNILIKIFSRIRIYPSFEEIVLLIFFVVI